MTAETQRLRGTNGGQRPPLQSSGLLFLLNWRRGFAERFAHQISRESPDDDVLAQLSDLGRDQFFHRLVRILDKPLLHQADRAVKLVELPADNFFHDVPRLAFDLSLDRKS